MKIVRVPAVAIVSLAMLSSCSFSGAPAVRSGAQPAAIGSVKHMGGVPPSIIYVANFGGSDILGFPLNSRGHVVPIVDLSGPNTRIGFPQSVGVDSAANQYTMLKTSGTGRTHVGVFTVGATGNVAPTRVFTDAIASHHGRILAADPTGTVYLLYSDEHQHFGIDVFGAGATGVVMPSREIAGRKTLMDKQETIVSLFADDAGAVWWACDGEVGVSRVVGYAPGANGNVAPAVVLPADSITQIVSPTFAGVDTPGNVYVNSTGSNPSVLVFAPGATGDVAPIRSMQLPVNYHVTTVYEEALIADGTVGLGNPAIAVFDANGSGPQQPLRVISGAKTKLNQPAGVAIN
jgi:hypothetical protein